MLGRDWQSVNLLSMQRAIGLDAASLGNTDLLNAIPIIAKDSISQFASVSMRTAFQAIYSNDSGFPAVKCQIMSNVRLRAFCPGSWSSANAT